MQSRRFEQMLIDKQYMTRDNFKRLLNTAVGEDLKNYVIEMLHEFTHGRMESSNPMISFEVSLINTLQSSIRRQSENDENLPSTIINQLRATLAVIFLFEKIQGRLYSLKPKKRYKDKLKSDTNLLGDVQWEVERRITQLLTYYLGYSAEKIEDIEKFIKDIVQDASIYPFMQALQQGEYPVEVQKFFDRKASKRQGAVKQKEIIVSATNRNNHTEAACVVILDILSNCAIYDYGCRQNWSNEAIETNAYNFLKTMQYFGECLSSLFSAFKRCLPSCAGLFRRENAYVSIDKNESSEEKEKEKERDGEASSLESGDDKKKYKTFDK